MSRPMVDLLDLGAQALHADRRAKAIARGEHALDACPCRWVNDDTDPHDLDRTGVCRRCGCELHGTQSQAMAGCERCNSAWRDWPALTDAQRERFREEARPVVEAVMQQFNRACDLLLGWLFRAAGRTVPGITNDTREYLSTRGLAVEDIDPGLSSDRPVDRERVLDAMAAAWGHRDNDQVWVRARCATLYDRLMTSPLDLEPDQRALAVARALGWEPPGGAK